MPRTREGWRALRVPMPIEEHERLAELRGPRKWRTWLNQIQDDFRKASEINQELRKKIEFLEAQIERLGG